MIIPKEIVVAEDVMEEIVARGLTKQLDKIVSMILAGVGFGSHYFRLRKPKSAGIWYCRLNKKRRLLGSREGDTFLVTVLDDHQ